MKTSKFKRSVALVLSLVLALSLALTGCGEEASPSYPEQEELALALVANMQSGEFAAVFDTFTPEMQEALSAEDLEAAWLNVTAAIGTYTAHRALSVKENNGIISAEVIEDYSEMGLVFLIAFDGENRVAGLRLNYAPLEETVEASGNFTEESITVTADENYPLDGILTLPNGVEKPPVVVLVHGSGPSDKDETVYMNTFFKDLAHALAEQGVASIRYDKRTYTYGEEIAAMDATDEFIRIETLDDANAAIALALADGRVDPARVYLGGHSMGGMLMPAILAENPQLAGGISMAGTLRQLWEVSYDQNVEAMEVLLPTLTAQELADLQPQLDQIEYDFAVLRNGLAAASGSGMLLGVPVAYWQSLEKYSGMNYLDEITAPMLILQGTADFQVFPETDYLLWQQALSGRDNVQFYLYEDLNHLFMPTAGYRTVEEYTVKRTVDALFVADIAAFVNG